MFMCSICHAKQTITWYHADFPPAFILHGKDKGKGYCDRMERDVADLLTGYEHRFAESNYKRIVISLREGRNICCASIYKTPEREKFSAYSDPLFIGLSNGVIIPKEQVDQYEKYLTPDGSLDLNSLITQEQSIRIGVIAGRNYGPSVEEVIAPFRKTDKIDERSGNDSKGLLLKLREKRVHMILALPMEIAYIVRQAGMEGNRFLFFPIKDGIQYTTSHMACPDNDWGREVIDKINVIIRKKRPVFAKYYRDWLDESGAKTYSTLVQKVFGILPSD
jgi:uncharacterized protein (TIGR02285 family)